jgi:hypothetical protein
MDKKMGFMGMRARGQAMRSPVGPTSATQPTNKATGGATASPMDQPADHEKAIKIKLPPGLQNDVGDQDGEKATYLAKGFHKKQPDGSTHFHMQSLDGEPVDAGDVAPQETANSAPPDSDKENDPFGIGAALGGMA